MPTRTWCPTVGDRAPVGAFRRLPARLTRPALVVSRRPACSGGAHFRPHGCKTFVVVVISFKQNNDAVEWHGLEDDGQACSCLMGKCHTDACPPGSPAFGGADSGVGDKDGIERHARGRPDRDAGPFSVCVANCTATSAILPRGSLHRSARAQPRHAASREACPLLCGELAGWRPFKRDGGSSPPSPSPTASPRARALPWKGTIAGADYHGGSGSAPHASRSATWDGLRDYRGRADSPAAPFLIILRRE